MMEGNSVNWERLVLKDLRSIFCKPELESERQQVTDTIERFAANEIGKEPAIGQLQTLMDEKSTRGVAA